MKPSKALFTKGYSAGSLKGDTGGPYSSKPNTADIKAITTASRNFQLKNALLNSSFNILLTSIFFQNSLVTSS
jgi:hypothetical protein